MAAAVPVADAPPLTTTVACSNEAMESWGRRRLRGLPDGLNPEAICAWRERDGRTVWHRLLLMTTAASTRASGSSHEGCST